MKKLTIENFIAAAEDYELSKYLILARLKMYNELLHQNKLYPALSDLIDLKYIFDTLTLQQTKINGKNTEDKIIIDINDDEENIEISENDVSIVLKLIEWAVPQIHESINEGRVIYDFVEKNLNVESVGIIPLYKNEGYFIITNDTEGSNQIYRFYLSSISESENNLLTFKTTLIETLSSADEETSKPECLKLELTKKFPELPNPVFYKVETDIDFPFSETILPVAKRKLMQQIAA